MPLTRFTFLLIALTAMAWGTGCSGSKAYTKRGLKMEEVGMMPQAASFYYTAVQKKATNTEALAGLQRFGNAENSLTRTACRRRHLIRLATLSNPW